MLERLQKILSARGVASRRKAEEYILAGLVKVNGKVATLGQKADPLVDRVEVEGQVMEERAEMLYYLMNKPVGVETSNVERGVKGIKGEQGVKGMTNTKTSFYSSNSFSSSSASSTIRDLLPPNLRGKIFPVGRLDKDSSGLLLLTNDGVLAYRLTHPKFDHEKEYEVTVAQPIKDGQLRKLRDGLMIDGSKTKPAVIKHLAPNRFLITLTEGRYRQIRRMCQKVGSTVTVLTRVRIVTLTDTGMKPGELRLLTKGEKGALLKSVGLS